MKKLFALLLAVIMILGLCACGTAGEGTEDTSEATETLPYNGSIPEVEGFQVGFARDTIIPDQSVPIAGLGRSTQRMSTSVFDDLCVSCYAITDAQGTTILLYSVDLQRSDTKIFDNVRKSVSQTTGIPEGNIYVTATHTHSGPDTYATSHPSILPYNQKVTTTAVQVAFDAIADRMPATMAYSSIEAVGLSSVRHYTYVDANGQTQYFGDNFGTAVVDSTTGHTTDVDPTLYVLHFAREGGKDVVLANWRAHPHLFTSETSYKLTADFPGAFRTAMETLYDCYFGYFQGAAGNVNTGSRIASEKRTSVYGEYGKILAEYVIEAMQSETPVTDTTIQVRQTMKEFEQNHLEDHLYSTAMIVQSAWNKGATNAEATALGIEKGIHSAHHANMIISKYNKGESFVSELNAIAFGDSVCFVTAPHELFDTNAVWLEEQSPYDVTLTFGYTNGLNGYVPSQFAWEHGCYEVDSSNNLPGDAELIQNIFLEMLQEMKG